MRTRKISLLYILIVVGMILLYLFQSQSSQPKKAPQPHHQAAINAETSIDKAQQKLVSSVDEISTYQRVLLDYLQRKFSLSPTLSAANTHIKNTEDVSSVEYGLLQRIAYPNELAGALPSQVEIGPTDYMVVAAANCDHIAPPADLAVVMRENIHTGSYNLTHVLLSLQFMSENGCTVPLSTTEQSQVVQKVADIAAKEEGIGDLGYEAIALLLYTDHRELIKPVWIQNIINHQLPDGGWTDGGDAKDAWNDHATFLALWALLEYEHPDAPKEPMIRRPN